MSKKLTLWARFKAATANIAVASRNAPLFFLTACVSLSVELYAWSGVFASNTGVASIAGQSFRLAWPEAIISVAFTLLALNLSGAAAAQKADPRGDQRKRAGATQWLAIAVLAVPLYFAGSCGAITAQNAARTAYIESPAYAADLAQSRDNSMDSMAQREAAASLRKAQAVTSADLEHLIPSMAWFALVLGANMLAVRLGFQARPETAEEVSARGATARAKQAWITRQENQRRDQEAGNVQPIGSARRKA